MYGLLVSVDFIYFIIVKFNIKFSKSILILIQFINDVEYKFPMSSYSDTRT